MTHHPFDEYAEGYDRTLEQAIGVSGESGAFFARGRIAWVARRLPEMSRDKPAVLDFGCGPGSAAPLLVELLSATSVLGVDVSRRSIEVAQKTHGGGRVAFLPMADYVPNGDLDVAYCNGVFHHVPPAERLAAASYVYRALRPGGLFALWENNPWNPATRLVMSRCEFDRDAITLTPKETRSLVEAAGFEVLGTDFMFIFPRALRFMRWLEPHLARLPFGTQYLVLSRKPAQLHR